MNQNQLPYSRSDRHFNLNLQINTPLQNYNHKEYYTKFDMQKRLQSNIDQVDKNIEKCYNNLKNLRQAFHLPSERYVKHEEEENAEQNEQEAPENSEKDYSSNGNKNIQNMNLALDPTKYNTNFPTNYQKKFVKIHPKSVRTGYNYSMPNEEESLSCNITSNTNNNNNTRNINLNMNLNNENNTNLSNLTTIQGNKNYYNNSLLRKTSLDKKLAKYFQEGKVNLDSNTAPTTPMQLAKNKSKNSSVTNLLRLQHLSTDINNTQMFIEAQTPLLSNNTNITNTTNTTNTNINNLNSNFNGGNEIDYIKKLKFSFQEKSKKCKELSKTLKDTVKKCQNLLKDNRLLNKALNERTVKLNDLMKENKTLKMQLEQSLKEQNLKKNNNYILQKLESEKLKSILVEYQEMNKSLQKENNALKLNISSMNNEPKNINLDKKIQEEKQLLFEEAKILKAMQVLMELLQLLAMQTLVAINLLWVIPKSVVIRQ